MSVILNESDKRFALPTNYIQHGEIESLESGCTAHHSSLVQPLIILLNYHTVIASILDEQAGL